MIRYSVTREPKAEKSAWPSAQKSAPETASKRRPLLQMPGPWQPPRDPVPMLKTCHASHFSADQASHRSALDEERCTSIAGGSRNKSKPWPAIFHRRHFIKSVGTGATYEA